MVLIITCVVIILVTPKQKTAETPPITQEVTNQYVLSKNPTTKLQETYDLFN